MIFQQFIECFSFFGGSIVPKLKIVNIGVMCSRMRLPNDSNYFILDDWHSSTDFEIHKP